MLKPEIPAPKMITQSRAIFQTQGGLAVLMSERGLGAF
jgi:hypothetical protein